MRTGGQGFPGGCNGGRWSWGAFYRVRGAVSRQFRNIFGLVPGLALRHIEPPRPTRTGKGSGHKGFDAVNRSHGFGAVGLRVRDMDFDSEDHGGSIPQVAACVKGLEQKSFFFFSGILVLTPALVVWYNGGGHARKYYQQPNPRMFSPGVAPAKPGLFDWVGGCPRPDPPLAGGLAHHHLFRGEWRSRSRPCWSSSSSGRWRPRRPCR